MTSALVFAAEHAHELAPIIAPPLVIAGIAAVLFAVGLIVTWSFRDVAHRYADRIDRRAQNAHGAGH